MDLWSFIVGIVVAWFVGWGMRGSWEDYRRGR
jgi:hypothetical protein